MVKYLEKSNDMSHVHLMDLDTLLFIKEMLITEEEYIKEGHRSEDNGCSVANKRKYMCIAAKNYAKEMLESFDYEAVRRAITTAELICIQLRISKYQGIDWYAIKQLKIESPSFEVCMKLRHSLLDKWIEHLKKEVKNESV